MTTSPRTAPSADPAARLRALATSLDDGHYLHTALRRTYPDVPMDRRHAQLADDIAAVLLHVPEVSL